VGSETFNSFGARWDIWDFTKGSTAKRICRLSIPSISAQCTLPSLASLFWLFELSFRREFEINVFTGKWKFVTFNGYRPSSEDQKFVMNVNMRLICIFWVKLFRQIKAKFCLFFFDLKKNSALKNIQNFKILKKSHWEQPNFKLFKKAKFVTLLLE